MEGLQTSERCASGRASRWMVQRQLSLTRSRVGQGVGAKAAITVTKSAPPAYRQYLHDCSPKQASRWPCYASLADSPESSCPINLVGARRVILLSTKVCFAGFQPIYSPSVFISKSVILQYGTRCSIIRLRSAQTDHLLRRYVGQLMMRLLARNSRLSLILQCAHTQSSTVRTALSFRSARNGYRAPIQTCSPNITAMMHQRLVHLARPREQQLLQMISMREVK